MSLPDVSDVCVSLDAETGLDARLGVDLAVALKDLKIALPGGFTLQAKASQKIPNPGDLVADLLAQLNAALGPFQPIFDLIDIALATVKVFDAVKSLNPIKIGNELVKLVAKVDVVAQIIPILSLPKTLRDTIDAILVFLAGLKASLQVSLTAQLKLDAAQAKHDALVATGNPAAIDIAVGLQASIACGTANLNAQLQAQANAMAPLNRFLALLSALCELVGLPPLPTLDLDADADLSVAIAAVDALMAALVVVRDAIPV